MANTLFEFYQGQGQKLPSVGERAQIFEQRGLGRASEYQGSAAQNTALLNSLQTPVAPAAAPAAPTPTILDAGRQTPPNVSAPPAAEMVADTTPEAVAGFEQSQRSLDDFIKEINQPIQETEAQRSNVQERLLEQLGELGKRGERTRQVEEQFGRSENVRQLQALNTQIAQTTAEFNKAIEGLSAGTGLSTTIAGKQGQLRRQKAVELGGLTAAAQAAQGNIALAEATAQRTVDLEFEPIENEIAILTTQLDFIRDDLTGQEKRRAEALTLELDRRSRELEQQKELRTQTSNIMLEAAKNGADASTLKSITDSKSTYDAISAASKYLQTKEQGNWSMFEDSSGNLRIFDKNTGIIKGAETYGSSFTFDSEGNLVPTTTEIAKDYFTDANGVSWNITGWAVDPTKTAQMQSISDRIGKVTDENLDAKVAEFTPGLTADMIRETSRRTGVSWEALMTMVNQESNGGTSNVARKNNNFGGLTFNNQEWIKPYGGTRGTERPSAEGGNYIKFPTPQDGLNAMGALMAQYGTVDTATQENPEAEFYFQQYSDGKLTTNQILDNIDDSTVRSAFMNKILTQPTKQDDSVVSESKQTISLINEIVDHKGLDSRVGPTKAARRKFAILDKFGAGQEFAAKVQQLTSQETLNTLKNLKREGTTLGALSQTELNILERAATAINGYEIKDENGLGTGEWDTSEAAFKRELRKIEELAKQAMARSVGAEVVILEDGTQWKKNNDGTYTQI